MANVYTILIKSKKGWQVHLNGEAARCDSEISDARVVEWEPGRMVELLVASVKWALGERHICSEGKRVHL